MDRVRVVDDPDRFPDSAGIAGTVLPPEAGWEPDDMVFVQLDNGLDGLYWPVDLEDA